MHVSPLLTVAYFAPMALGGIFFSTIGGFILHRLPGRVLLVLSATGHFACTLLFALMPEGGSYWPFVFPAMIGATIGIDVVYTVSSVFITTSIPLRHQGVAGALINSLIFLGIGFWLGIADLARSSTSYLGLRKSYQAAFWLAVGCSVVAFVLFLFIKISPAKSTLTEEEKERMQERTEPSLDR
jgi:MFS family permease